MGQRTHDLALSPPRVHALRFPALDRDIDCAENETLFAAARRHGLRIVGACGGTRHLRQLHGAGARRPRAPRGQGVRAFFAQEVAARLLRATAFDLVADVAPRSLAPVVRADVRTGGEDRALTCEPLVAAQDLQLPPASLQDLLGDVDRVRRALAQQGQPRAVAVDWAAAAELPTCCARTTGAVSLRSATHGGVPRIIGFCPPRGTAAGPAVDLGTTNAAAFLLDLKTGRRLASLGLENPQAAWGADLISRINHAIKEPGAAEALRRAAVNAINALAHDPARAVGAQASDIADAVVCGNTAMQHLLAGWPVSQLGRAPFVPAMNEALDVPARELGLKLAAGANLHLAASVGGFVGGDHVTALLPPSRCGRGMASAW